MPLLHRLPERHAMKLLILGATGPTGTHVPTRALDHGDDVSVLVRSPE